MMEDFEVGEKWKQSLDDSNRPYGTTGQAIVQDLIRKLVEERALLWNFKNGVAGGTAGIYKALRDFGIPRETWKP
jgi:hypothetical protein